MRPYANGLTFGILDQRDPLGNAYVREKPRCWKKAKRKKVEWARANHVKSSKHFAQRHQPGRENQQKLSTAVSAAALGRLLLLRREIGTFALSGAHHAPGQW